MERKAPQPEGVEGQKTGGYSPNISVHLVGVDFGVWDHSDKRVEDTLTSSRGVWSMPRCPLVT